VPLPSPSPADPTAAYTTEPLVPLPSPSLADPTAAYKLKGLDDAYQAYDLVIDAHNSPTDGNKQETAAKQNIAMADLSKSSGYCDKTNSNPDTFDLELHTDPLQRFSASKDHNACLPYNSTDSPAVPNATRHQTHLSSNGEPILLRQSMIKHTHFIKDISPNWHLYAIIAILTAIILALWFWPTNPPITPEIKTQKPVELTNSHAVTLFLAQVPTFDQNNITQHRLEAIHTLNRDYAVITSLWQLAPELLRSWQKYLSAKVISHQNFLKVAQHIPFEPSNFKDIDRSIYMAALAMFEIIAPDYLRYLDEIEGPIALPPSSPQNSPSPLFQQQYRQLLVRNWLNIAPKLGWKSWQLQLLAERTLCHTPQAPKSKLNASMAQKFKPCLEYLNQAHGILLQNEPQHPILPQILNRIQIYQALLQKSQAK
jgi:hypothetical protein